MLLSHTPTGAAAPDYVFCPKLAIGGQHQPAIRVGATISCPRACAAVCPLQVGACAAPAPQPTRLALVLSYSLAKAQLLAPAVPLIGLLICRN